VSLLGGQVDLCVDIKCFPDSPQGIEIKLLFILSHYDYLDRTLFSSFDYRCLRRVRELAPESRIAVIFGSGVGEDPFHAAKHLGAVAIHVQKELATRDFLHRAWEEGLDVCVWTVNELRDMKKFALLGVQGMVSDFPEKFKLLRGV
jgi:glycerophosphoryl diester phosphodiesterase